MLINGGRIRARTGLDRQDHDLRLEYETATRLWAGELEVVHEIAERTEAVGRTVDASPDAPQYQVRSDKSGRRAV
ncbi:DUF2945 domain-containing protein, partial [Streptomyces eurythermus]